MPSDTEAHGPTPFRTQEKRYKYKKSRPEWIDLDDAIDLRCKGDNPNIQRLAHGREQSFVPHFFTLV